MTDIVERLIKVNKAYKYVASTWRVVINSLFKYKRLV